MTDYCPITDHNIVKQYNKELVHYWHIQHIDLLYFGFPLDFNWNSPLEREGSSDKSATDCPRDIEAYLIEVLQFKALVGSFGQHPCPGFHILPFLTREKPNSEIAGSSLTSIGLWVNLSMQGIDKTSYLGADFLVTLPTIDHITDQLKTLGEGRHLYKIDIS